MVWPCPLFLVFLVHFYFKGFERRNIVPWGSAYFAPFEIVLAVLTSIASTSHY